MMSNIKFNNFEGMDSAAKLNLQKKYSAFSLVLRIPVIILITIVFLARITDTNEGLSEDALVLLQKYDDPMHKVWLAFLGMSVVELVLLVGIIIDTRGVFSNGAEYVRTANSFGIFVVSCIGIDWMKVQTAGFQQL